MAYELEERIEVAAPPATVYELVSDVTRTGEWSPQCHRCEWDSDARGVGATFTGHNRIPEREWQTVSTVVVADPGKEFAWEVGPPRALWGFRLRPTDTGGTELTQYTRVDQHCEQVFAERYGADRAPAELAIREGWAREGMPTTLRAIGAILDRE